MHRHLTRYSGAIDWYGGCALYIKTFLPILSFFPYYCSVLLDIIHNKYSFCLFHKHGENRVKFVVFCIVEFTVNLTTRHVEIHHKYSPRKHHKLDKSTIKIHQIYYWNSPDCQVKFTRSSGELHRTLNHHILWWNMWWDMWCIYCGEIHYIHFAQWIHGPS